MKYQLEYDKVLITNEDFVLEKTGEIISSVSMIIRFGKVFEGDLSESLYTYFEEADSTLPGLLRIAYDSESKEFEFHPHEILGDNYEIVGYTKDVGVGFAEGHFISKEEFEEIMEKYGHFFATDKSLQNCAYWVHEIEENDNQNNEVETIEEYLSMALGVSKSETYGYIARYSEEVPVWCFLLKRDGAKGEKYYGEHCPLNNINLEDLIKVFSLFSKQDRKIIVDTEGYLYRDRDYLFKNEFVLNSNPLEKIALHSDYCTLEGFINEDILYDSDKESYGYIARANEEQPVWCLFLRSEDSEGEKYCSGHYPLHITDMDDLIKAFSWYSEQGKRIVVNTEDYFFQREIKEMNYPNRVENNLPNATNYLIEKEYDDRYLIHRELEDKEINSFSEDEICVYKGKRYLAAIVVCSSEDKAVSVIKSYWRAIDILVERAVMESENKK
ncbi:hypothetical protein [Bacillus cereus]|uniref:Uncharacterized protein n=1 Tax=Bacillus cereus 03BB108 TaxID=451709 RepID=A0AAN0SRP9_BACCE|nr:hypothetical protein [Bacillus cereus]AJI09033.1 hypothetical protein AK40_6134 [Bacillus cereus 03BB108]EDX59490.1 conserved hypothetical protein [Bacillus cereus 03BB108]MBJ6723055.1 hypothetical protein [Bacillus sp. PR5]QKG98697.1 hypothetical protein FOC96_00115 [Bacillus cereus]